MDRRSFLGSSLGAVALWQQAPAPTAAPDADPLRIPEAAGRSRAPVAELDNSEVIKKIENQLRCTCGCNLDIFTCRTTDFTCTYSPALHLEIVGLYQTGLTPEQVIAAFVEKYGEQSLMAPPAEGFNLAGYLVPGLAVLAAGTMLGVVLLRRNRQAAVALAEGGTAAVGTASTAVSSEEMERLKQALTEVAD
jgi:cytochrome c-type biogenesis protein CcmH/NrfF